MVLSVPALELIRHRHESAEDGNCLGYSIRSMNLEGNEMEGETSPSSILDWVSKSLEGSGMNLKSLDGPVILAVYDSNEREPHELY